MRAADVISVFFLTFWGLSLLWRGTGGKYVALNHLKIESEGLVAATSKNVKSMLKSRKLQTRKTRTFMVDAKGFDGGQTPTGKRRSAKKKNFELARKLMDNYCLPD